MAKQLVAFFPVEKADGKQTYAAFTEKCKEVFRITVDDSGQGAVVAMHKLKANGYVPTWDKWAYKLWDAHLQRQGTKIVA